jgi:hypothetical protein
LTQNAVAALGGIWGDSQYQAWSVNYGNLTSYLTFEVTPNVVCANP